MRIIAPILFLFVCQLLTGQHTTNQLLSKQIEATELFDTAALKSYKKLLDSNLTDISTEDLIKYGVRGAKAAKSLGNDTLYVNFYLDNVISPYSTQLFDTDTAKELLDFIEKEVIQLNTDYLLGKFYHYKGVCFQIEQDYINALKAYTKVKEHTEKIGNYRSMMGLLYNISNIYRLVGDYHNAIDYAREALSLNDYLSKTDVLLNTAFTNYQVSINYEKLIEPDSASFYLKKAFQTIEKNNNINNHINGLAIYCDVYLKVLTNLASKEESIHPDSIAQKVAICKDFKKPSYELAMIDYHLKQKEYNQVDQLLADSSLYGINAIGDQLLLEYQSRSAIHKGNYKKAYQFQKEYNEQSLAYIQEDVRRYSTYLDAQFETSKKEEEIKLLEEVSKGEKLKSQLLFLALLFSLGILLLLGILFRKIRQNNKFLEADLENKKIIEEQAAELQKMDQLKSRLFTNVAHELRTPLTLITEPIERILQKNKLPISDQEQLVLAKNSSQQLLSLSNQIMDLTKGKIQELTVQLVRFKWKDFIDTILPFFRTSANNKSIQLTTNNEVGDDIYIQSDVIKLKAILKNLLHNALKYNKKQGTILFAAVDKEDHLLVMVEDTGKGIHEQDLPFVFDRYYQSKINTAPEGGFGIGLAICKEYIEALNGTIAINSTLGKGTTVSVRIPKIVNKNVQADVYTFKETILPNIASVTPKVVKEENASHLLIVEDHEELQKFLKSILEMEYQLSFAQDGERGLALLKTITPSLIITDWMMPNMDGMEFITKVKENPLWMHIPVLMLTARSFSVDHLKALQKGVDDYMIKPFTTDILKHRIEYLLESAESKTNEVNISWEDKYLTSQEVSKSKEGLIIQGKKDLKWISQLEQTILENIHQLDLTIEDIAKQMNISIPHLFRKIKAITGMTPKRFVDEVRYWEARRLLEENKVESVKSLAFNIGLKSVKNFSSNYKKRFGVSPSKHLN